MRKMDKLGFDNQKYLELQSAHIRERIRQFGNKLYLEFGGKLFDDHHASRVLPGFEPDSKIRMLKELRDSVEVVIAICASDIEKNKIRGDLGITYDVDVLRLIDAFRGEACWWAAWRSPSTPDSPPPPPSAAGWSTWGCRPASTTPSQATPTTPA